MSKQNLESAILVNSIINAIPEAVLLVNEKFQIKEYNQNLTHFLGYSKPDILGEGLESIIPKGLDELNVPDIDQFAANQSAILTAEEFLFANHTEGRQVPLKLSLCPVVIDEHQLFLVTLKDMTAEYENAKESGGAGQKDPITQLPDQQAFQQRLAYSLSANTDFSLAVIDVDNFERVETTQGVTVANQLLRLVSRRLQNRLRTTDYISRINKSHFGILIPNELTDNEKYLFVDKLHATLAKSFKISKHNVEASISIGLVQSSEAYKDSDQYLDIAYMRKEREKSLRDTRKKLKIIGL
jgi:diguanylate cyclase (GGDEF)-like protein/PAS domain S-box-containing protein